MFEVTKLLHTRKATSQIVFFVYENKKSFVCCCLCLCCKKSNRGKVRTKREINKMTRKNRVLGGGGKRVDFAKHGFFRKVAQTLIVFDLERKGIFGAHNCFGHLLSFGGFLKTNTNNIETVNLNNFQKMHPSFQKGFCGMSAKRVSLSVVHKNNALLKILFFLFSANTTIAGKRV